MCECFYVLITVTFPFGQLDVIHESICGFGESTDISIEEGNGQLRWSPQTAALWLSGSDPPGVIWNKDGCFADSSAY